MTTTTDRSSLQLAKRCLHQDYTRGTREGNECNSQFKSFLVQAKECPGEWKQNQITEHVKILEIGG